MSTVTPRARPRPAQAARTAAAWSRCARADRDPVGPSGVAAVLVVATGPRRAPAAGRTTRAQRPYRLGVGAQGVPGGQLQQAPAGRGGLVEHPVARAEPSAGTANASRAVAVPRCRCGTACTGRTRRETSGAAEAGSRQDTGSRCCGRSGLWASSTATALCTGRRTGPPTAPRRRWRTGRAGRGRPRTAPARTARRRQQRVRAHLVRLVDDRPRPACRLDVGPLRGRGDDDRAARRGRRPACATVRPAGSPAPCRTGCAAGAVQPADGERGSAAASRHDEVVDLLVRLRDDHQRLAGGGQSRAAARTTSVDLPAPGGESTTTPRCAPCSVSGGRAVASAAAAPGPAARSSRAAAGSAGIRGERHDQSSIGVLVGRHVLGGRAAVVHGVSSAAREAAAPGRPPWSWSA